MNESRHLTFFAFAGYTVRAAQVKNVAIFRRSCTYL